MNYIDPHTPQWDYHSGATLGDKWKENVRNQKALPPQTVTLESLFPKIERWAIGFDPIFETLQQMSSAKVLTYPPYNLTKLKNGKFQIEVALAGFRKEDVHITLEERTLTISSEVEGKDKPPTGEVIHHGIAQRNFKQQFALAEFVEVDSADMKDGILTINLVTNIPEEKKPKVIDIK
jgi:molecular chaperone IbpA